jgi:hypothetical protein
MPEKFVEKAFLSFFDEKFSCEYLEECPVVRD